MSKKNYDKEIKEAERLARKLAYWNYRVVRSVEPKWPDTPYLQIYEVFYDSKDNPHSWTVDPILPMGETLGELRKDIKYMIEALKKPILEVKVVRGKEKLVEWKPK